MKIDLLSIPAEGKEIAYREDPHVLELSPELEFKEDLSIQAYLYKAGKRVIVKGTIDAAPYLDCGRCSDRFLFPLVIEFEQSFSPMSPLRPPGHRESEDRGSRKPARGRSSRHAEPDREEEEEEIDLAEENPIEGNTLSLDEVIREQVLLALPMRPLCSPDCKGICPVCRINWNRASCDCPREEVKEGPFDRMKNLLTQKSKKSKGD